MADAPEEPTIETVSEAEEAIDRIGELSTEIGEKKSQQKREKAKLKKRFARMIQPREREKKTLADAVEDFARKNESDLKEQADGKTVELLTGTIAFVKARTRLVYTRDQEAIIQELREAGKEEYIITEEKLSKRMLMKAWDDVKGTLGLEKEQPPERVKIKPYSES